MDGMLSYLYDMRLQFEEQIKELEKSSLTQVEKTYKILEVCNKYKTSQLGGNYKDWVGLSNAQKIIDTYTFSKYSIEWNRDIDDVKREYSSRKETFKQLVDIHTKYLKLIEDLSSKELGRDPSERKALEKDVTELIQVIKHAIKTNTDAYYDCCVYDFFKYSSTIVIVGCVIWYFFK